MPYAEPYARIISTGISLGMFATATSYFIRSDGNPNYASAVLLSGAIFNIIFDPLFLFVFKMGIEGTALVTTLGQMLSAAVAFSYLLRKFKSVSITGVVRYMRIFLFMTFANALQLITSPFFSSIGRASPGFWMVLIRQGLL